MVGNLELQIVYRDVCDLAVFDIINKPQSEIRFLRYMGGVNEFFFSQED